MPVLGHREWPAPSGATIQGTRWLRGRTHPRSALLCMSWPLGGARSVLLSHSAQGRPLVLWAHRGAKLAWRPPAMVGRR